MSGVAFRKRCCFDDHLEDAFTAPPRTILLASLALTDFAVGLVVQPLFISLRIASYGGLQEFYQVIFTVYPFTVCAVFLSLHVQQ